MDASQPAAPRRYRRRAGRAVTITPAMLDGAPDFAPVPRGATRYDGWTADRQRAFVKALAELGSVRHAARAVGMSEVGAYQLRKAPGGEGFAQAWSEALLVGVARLADVAMERALDGVPVPVFHKGEQVGEKRWYNDRLLMWVLRHHDPANYGGPIGHRVPPHVRAALRMEWEKEQAEQRRQDAEGSTERFHTVMETLRRRLQASGRLPPDLAEYEGKISPIQRYVILCHHHAEMEAHQRETPDEPGS